MILGAKQVITAVVTLIVVLVVVGGLWYVINLKANLAVSEMNAKQLKDGVEQQQQLIAAIREDVSRIQVANAQIQEREAEQKKEVASLQDKFKKSSAGDERDFGSLSASKPKVAEKLINRGTVNAMRCLELASGAPHTEKELSITTAEEINRECPALANPNYKPKS